MHLQLVKMTGNDIDPLFEKMWRYVHGSLPENEYAEAVKNAKLGLENIHVKLLQDQEVSVPRYLKSRGVDKIIFRTCCACGV